MLYGIVVKLLLAWGRQARLGWLRSWYGMRGLLRVAILDGGLGCRGKAGVGLVCCLLLKHPIQARQTRALASRWLLLLLLGRPAVPQWGVATDAKGFRHVAVSGCRGLGEYLPTKPNALEWL